MADIRMRTRRLTSDNRTRDIASMGQNPLSPSYSRMPWLLILIFAVPGC